MAPVTGSHSSGILRETRKAQFLLGRAVPAVGDEIDVRAAVSPVDVLQAGVLLGAGITEVRFDAKFLQHVRHRLAPDEAALAQPFFGDALSIHVAPRGGRQLLDLLVATRVVGEPGARSGFGPITVAPASTSSAIFLSTAGDIVRFSGSTSRR